MIGRRHIKDLFSSGARVPSVTDARRPLVNYIWIATDGPAEKNNDTAFSNVSLQHIDRVIANANRYKQADFNIWLDRARSNDAAQFWVRFIVGMDARYDNVRVRDLRDIPAYAANGIFSKNFNGGAVGFSRIYFLADLARVVVMDHCIGNRFDPRRYVLYSDMDCVDLKLEKALSIVKKYGIVINHLGLGAGDTISHGYFGLDADRADVRAGLPRLLDETMKDASDNCLGYHAFERYVDRLGWPFKRRAAIRMRVLPDIGTCVAANPKYRMLGIG